MEAQISIPTPKTIKSKELSRDDRLRVQTLYFDANFTRAQICLQTGYTYDQVTWALAHRLTPQKKAKSGRHILLNTPQRKRLIDWVTASQTNRQTPWNDIPRILGWDCGEKAIRTAFKREGFRRCLSRKKPRLSPENVADRLAWAEQHKDWSDE
jgi:hypothetical protein